MIRLSCADNTFRLLQPWESAVELIRLLRPDVLVKGADYTVEQVVGGELVQEYGGQVRLAELLPGQSTTATVARIKG